MKTYEVYIDRTETFLVQALDIDAAKGHALGEEPDAPGCVLQSFGTETNDVRAVRVADILPGGREAAPIEPEVDHGNAYRAALESIAQDRAMYASELQNIARRALGLEPL